MIVSRISRYSHKTSDKTVLRDVYLTILPGRVACLVGMSGVGKTTLLKVLLGLLHLQRKCDKVEFHVGREILDPTLARRRGYVGVVPQNPTLIPWLNIEKNLLLPSRLNSGLEPPARSNIEDILTRLGLFTSILNHYPHELSCGMQQRASFARTVLYSPKFLFFDELFSGLDTMNADTLVSETSSYVRRTKSTCLLVTHDIDRALCVADDLLFHSVDGCVEVVPLPVDRSTIAKRLKDEWHTMRSAYSLNSAPTGDEQ